jgi:hypothetical protein
MRGLAGGLLALLLGACVPGSTLDQVRDGEEIETADFTVEAPPGSWEFDRRPNDILLTQRKHWLINVVRTTIVRISRFRATGKAADWPEERIADDYCDQELDVLRSRGSQAFEVNEVIRNPVDRGGKHLYYLGIKTTLRGVTPEPDQRTVSATYIYFGPSFPKTRTYYALAISQTQERTLDEEPFDLSPLDPVIRSFRLKYTP